MPTKALIDAVHDKGGTISLPHASRLIHKVQGIHRVTGEESLCLAQELDPALFPLATGRRHFLLVESVCDPSPPPGRWQHSAISDFGSFNPTIVSPRNPAVVAFLTNSIDTSYDAARTTFDSLPTKAAIDEIWIDSSVLFGFGASIGLCSGSDLITWNFINAIKATTSRMCVHGDLFDRQRAWDTQLRDELLAITLIAGCKELAA